MEVNFKDHFGNIISEDETIIRNSYIKIYKIGSVIKKEESFSSGYLTVVDYKKDANESIPEILSKYDSHIPIHITVKIEAFKNGKMDYVTSYLNHESYLKERTLENAKDGIIFTQKLDIETNLPIISSTEKYYNINDLEYYRFSYDNEGSLRNMLSTFYLNEGSWRISDLENLHGF